MTGQTAAERILVRLGITEPREIDLEAIAWELGVRIKYRPLDGCEARIVGRSDKAIITVNVRSSRRRRRFSIGHELGHWHYDRGRMVVCLADDIGRAAVSDSNHPERLADQFASQLLMPEYLFRPIACAYAKFDFQKVCSIAEIFDTSRTATALRLVEGGYIPAVLVCHSQDGRKWFARSPDVPYRWFPRKDLAAESFAFGVLFGHQADDKFPRKIGADAWFDRADAEHYEVLEQTMQTGSDEILTLVTIEDDDMLREYSDNRSRFRFVQG